MARVEALGWGVALLVVAGYGCAARGAERNPGQLPSISLDFSVEADTLGITNLDPKPCDRRDDAVCQGMSAFTLWYWQQKRATDGHLREQLPSQSAAAAVAYAADLLYGKTSLEDPHDSEQNDIYAIISDLHEHGSPVLMTVITSDGYKHTVLAYAWDASAEELSCYDPNIDLKCRLAAAVKRNPDGPANDWICEGADAGPQCNSRPTRYEVVSARVGHAMPDFSAIYEKWSEPSLREPRLSLPEYVAPDSGGPLFRVRFDAGDWGDLLPYRVTVKIDGDRRGVQMKKKSSRIYELPAPAEGLSPGQHTYSFYAEPLYCKGDYWPEVSTPKKSYSISAPPDYVHLTLEIQSAAGCGGCVFGHTPSGPVFQSVEPGVILIWPEPAGWTGTKVSEWCVAVEHRGQSATYSYPQGQTVSVSALPLRGWYLFPTGRLGTWPAPSPSPSPSPGAVPPLPGSVYPQNPCGPRDGVTFVIDRDYEFGSYFVVLPDLP